MKLLKKLLPIATLASTAAIVAPIVTSCGSSFNMIDVTKKYTPTIEQYKPTTEEAEGVTEEKALEIYVNAVSKNCEIIIQDILASITKDAELPSGMSMLIGIKINKIDLANKTVDYEVQQTQKGKYTRDGITYEGDTTTWVKVTNSKIKMNYSTSWNANVGSYMQEQFGDQVVVGKTSGWHKQTTDGKTVETKYSGKEITVKKDTAKPTDPTELAEFQAILSLSYIYFDSYFLKNLKYKA